MAKGFMASQVLGPAWLPGEDALKRRSCSNGRALSSYPTKG